MSSSPTSSEIQWEFSALKSSHDRGSFECGVPELDDFLKTKAKQYSRRKLAQTFVAFPVDKPTRIDGYFSISMASIEVSSIPAAVSSKYPKHPLPVALIGRLATSKTVRGKGLGGLLLMDAFKRCLSLAEDVGCAAVIVDSKGEASTKFYKKYGFIELTIPRNRLFIPIDVIQEAFGE